MTGSSGNAALAGGIAGAGGAIGQALTRKAERKREQERYEDIKAERKRERDQELANQAALARITAAQARRQDALRAVEATLGAKQAVLDGLVRDASEGRLGLPHEYMPLLKRELDAYLATSLTPIKQGQLVDLVVEDGTITPEWGPAGEADPATADGPRAFYNGLLARGSALADPQYRAAASEKLAKEVLPLVESIMDKSGQPNVYKTLSKTYFGYTGDFKKGVYQTGSIPDSYDTIPLLDNAVDQLREHPEMIHGSPAQWLLDKVFPYDPANGPMKRILNAAETGSGITPGEAAAGRQFLMAAASQIKNLLDKPPNDLPEGAQERLLTAYREVLGYTTRLRPLEVTLMQHGGVETMVKNIRAKLGTTGTARETYGSLDQIAQIAQYVDVYGPKEGKARWEAERPEGPPAPGSYDVFDMLSAEVNERDPITPAVINGKAVYKNPVFISSMVPAPEPAPVGAFDTGKQAGQKAIKSIGEAIDYGMNSAGKAIDYGMNSAGNAAVAGAKGVAKGAAGAFGFGTGLMGGFIEDDDLDQMLQGGAGKDLKEEGFRP